MPFMRRCGVFVLAAYSNVSASEVWNHVARKRAIPSSVESEASDATISTRQKDGLNGTSHDMSKYDGLQELYVDRLLAASDKATDARGAQSPCLPGLGVFGSEYSLTFFPEARLSALATQLGHDRVSHVRARVADVTAECMKTIECVPTPAADSDRIHIFGMNGEFAANCVQCE